jgi:phosphopentomutase
MNRVIIIVLDSVGIGDAPDAAAYGDAGANTLVNMSRIVPGGLQLPSLQSLGLGNIAPGQIIGCPAADMPRAAFGRCREASAGKDTTTGHWEMAGIITREPFPTFPDGFPQPFMERWALTVGVDGWLHNKPASGTEIIKRFGELHIASGLPIVYTSADSVFQIAAHETHFGLQRLYDICAKTRRMLDPQRVGRVIARPFVGASAETFTRTANRHDYSLAPPEPHDLTRIRGAGMSVLGIGKIHDIFAGSGITATLRTKSNAEGMTVLRQQLETFTRGLIFVNLVEFDMIYGHRRDPQGYAHCLQEFDTQLTGLLPCLRGDDLLMLCADHGLDPTFPGTDHTRETVPILLYSPALPARALGVRSSFADIGATACAALGVAMSTPSAGQSLLT